MQSRASDFAAMTHCYARLRQLCGARRFDYLEARRQCARLRQLAFAVGEDGTAVLAGLARRRLMSLERRADMGAHLDAVALINALDAARGEPGARQTGRVLIKEEALSG